MVDPAGGGTSCIEAFCLSYPGGWLVAEEGTRHISLAHSEFPEVVATASLISQQALVENAGGTWPASTQTVVESFWALLEEASVGSFDRLERLTGGAYRSEGSHDDGRLWHLLIPLDGSEAIGVEMRAPNRSWEPHADAIFAGVAVPGATPTPGGSPPG